MQIDSKRIRAEREKRAWSQEHLAEVAELALRTIQRVEASGAGSYETAKALAAVFEMDVAALRPADVPPPPRFKQRVRYWSVAVSVALAASLVFFARQAIAGQVMLDVGLSINGAELGKSQLITRPGKDAEILFKGKIRVMLQSRVNKDGSVAVAMRVYEFSREQFFLVSTPEVFVLDNNQAQVRLTSALGNVFRIAITPHKI